jgi:hypothetical protein
MSGALQKKFMPIYAFELAGCFRRANEGMKILQGTA